ncbi:Uncharacterized protein AC507_1553 [Pseudomonas syringae pv. maculicola]|nr:Uncharacterized protein AC507_1553 [Pseudomonas syringae pv. maculicola]
MNDLKQVMQRLCQLAIGRVTGDHMAGQVCFCTGLRRVAQKRGGCRLASRESMTAH